ESMSGLMSQQSHAFGFTRAFDFQHLLPLEPHQTRMSQVEWDTESGNAVRREPLFGKPHVRSKGERFSVEFLIKLPHSLLQRRPHNFQLEIAQPHVQELG